MKMTAVGIVVFMGFPWKTRKLENSRKKEKG